MTNPRNGCRGCGEDFASLALFDAHRVGKHAYTYAEGLRMSPPREDGRRCLDVEEMLARGWRRDSRGRWQDPRSAERAAARAAASAARRMRREAPAKGVRAALRGHESAEGYFRLPPAASGPSRAEGTREGRRREARR